MLHFLCGATVLQVVAFNFTCESTCHLGKNCFACLIHPLDAFIASKKDIWSCGCWFINFAAPRGEEFLYEVEEPHLGMGSKPLCDFKISDFKIYFKISRFICHMHNTYMEAVIGNKILLSQALSNNAQKICIKKITQVKGELNT